MRTISNVRAGQKPFQWQPSDGDRWLMGAVCGPRVAPVLPNTEPLQGSLLSPQSATWLGGFGTTLHCPSFIAEAWDSPGPWSLLWVTVSVEHFKCGCINSG